MPLLPTIKEEESPTLLQRLWRYRLQFQLMIPASMIFLAGGLKLGWTTFETPSPLFDIEYNSNHLTVSYFIGGILGCILASLFVGRVTKNIANVASGSLLIVGGILFVAMPNIYIALTFGCLFEGIAIGLTQVQTFSTGAELTTKDIRGIILSTERCFVWFGILLQLAFTYSWYALEPARGYHTIQADQIHGAAVTCLGLVSIIVTLKQRSESPLLLMRYQREMATAVLKQLTNTHLTTTEVMRMREDYLRMLAVDEDQSGWYTFRKHNARALVKVFVLRCFVTLAMSQPFNSVYLPASRLGFNCDTNCLYTMAAAGAFGSLLGSLLIDRCGRRRMCVVTLYPASIIMLVTGGIMKYLVNANVAMRRDDLEIIASLMLLFQFIICVGVSIAASVYLAEAFTVRQKSQCIATILIGEYVLQLALAVISDANSINGMIFFFAMGFLCMLLGLCVAFCMPETKCLTLYECLQKFKSV